MNTEITYFQHYSKTDKPYWTSVVKAFSRIQSGAIKEQIEAIRAETDKDKKRKLKDNLPCICFAGKFKKRKDDEQITHSGLAIFDFDHVDVGYVKSQLISLPFVFAAFISPSGDGVKALVRIPAEINYHREYYLAAAEEMKAIGAIDLTSQNPSRICFESYDPEIYINYDAKEFTKRATFVSTNTAVDFHKALFTDYNKVNPPLTMVRNAPDGQKHEILLKASKLMGGLISGGYVDELEGERLLTDEIQKRNVTNIQSAIDTIRDGIQYGKLLPIREDKIVVSDNSLDFVSTKEDERVYMDAVRSGTLKQGLETGMIELDRYFRFKVGNLVIINGHDNVGKSSVIWFLAVQSAILHGWKWILFCAENSEGQVRKNLIQFKTGKSSIHLNDAEYNDAMQWAYDHFTIIKQAELYTCGDVLKMGEKLYRTNHYDGFLIDPYNSLAIDMKEAQLGSHEYHYKVTAELRAFCKKFGASIFLNCHAVTEALRKVYKDGEYSGYLMPPNKADTEGGGKFANRADDFITIHRHTQHPTEFNVTQIHVRKIKETETGGRPTLRDEPVKIQMVKGKYGFFPVQLSTHELLPLKNINRYETANEEYPF